jgi:hypothetical protein
MITFKVPVYLRIRGNGTESAGHCQHGIKATQTTNASYQLVEKEKKIQNNTTTKTAIQFTAKSTTRKQFERRTFDCFERIFDTASSNAHVFSCLQPHIEDVLNGFHSTIFAYGQTGSGKTFTLTGGQTYSQRGLIPRAIEYIWQSPHLIRCSVSYIEIYNETCRDLLLDDTFGSTSNISFSRHDTTSENDCLDLLFQGNLKRMTTETYMNGASSRSHCIFTLFVETSNGKGDQQLAKLHLVDLAGSENVNNTARDVETLREGKAINLSLHYLEQVIVRLRAQHSDSTKSGKQPHLPTYRNSQLTSVLRDSLGGNCKLVFLANINPESQFINESVGTCRFGERCSHLEVENVEINKVVDLSVVVRNLEQKISSLQHQLEYVEGTHVLLTEQEIFEMNKFAELYLRSTGNSEKDSEAVTNLVSEESIVDLCRARILLQLLKGKFQALSKLYLCTKKNLENQTLKVTIDSLRKKLTDERVEISIKKREMSSQTLPPSQVKLSISGNLLASELNSSVSTMSSDSILVARKRRRVVVSSSLALDTDTERKKEKVKVNGSENNSRAHLVVQETKSQPPESIDTAMFRAPVLSVVEPLPEIVHCETKQSSTMSSNSASNSASNASNDQSREKHEGKKLNRVADTLNVIVSPNNHNHNDILTASDGVSLLIRGGMFLLSLKFSLQPRYVWLTADKEYVCWRKVGSTVKTNHNRRQLPIADLVDVIQGRKENNFSPWGMCVCGRNTQPNPRAEVASFSLCFHTQNLNLEIDVQSGHDESDTCSIKMIENIRDQWVSSFRAMITPQSRNRKPQMK